MKLAVYLRGFGGLLVFLFLVEEENNVGNVGNVGTLPWRAAGPAGNPFRAAVRVVLEPPTAAGCTAAHGGGRVEEPQQHME